jgi:hypothetical protein
MRLNGIFLGLAFCAIVTAAQSAPAPAAPGAAGWKPAQEDNTAVYGITEQYLAAEDSGDFARASAFLSDGMRKALSQNVWKATFAARAQKFGAMNSRQIVKITWEQNPPWAPGVYATAGYSAVFAKAMLYCGYVTWQLGKDGHFRVAREEFSGMGNDAVAKMDSGAIATFKTKYHCDEAPAQ